MTKLNKLISLMTPHVDRAKPRKLREREKFESNKKHSI